MKINSFTFAKIKVLMKRFEKSENKLHGIRFLKDILLILQKSGDKRAVEFVKQIQQDLDLNLSENWKLFKIPFPAMDVCYSIYKYMFLEDDLRNIPTEKNKTAWELLQSTITEIFDRYEVMFGQKVVLEIQK